MKTIFELEGKIANIITRDNGRTTHFEYRDATNVIGAVIGTRLIVTTYNNKNNESFALKMVEGSSKEDCLEKILTYLEITKPSQKPYHIRWKRKGEVMDITTSYFYCENIKEAIEHFFYGKDINEYEVFSAELAPIS